MGKKSKKFWDKPKEGPIAIEKDDGTRWLVMGQDGHQVYPGKGVRKSEAVRLATTLQVTGYVVQVDL